ncbi:MAG: M48 family metalloprotease, partial [Victivallales bacterium]|nr:M48 family metalloprotease [Victivallales bacterium]
GYAPAISPHRLPHLRSQRGSRGVLKLALKILFLPFAALVVFSACETVPITGRSRLLLTSMDEENRLGEQAWSEILRRERMSTNFQYATAVERVGRNIAEVSEAPGFKWEFRTFESQEANAFCLPGGKVAVYTGIFKFVDNDAELATVIGHEVAHAIARHGGERLSHEYVRVIGQTVLETATQEKYRELAVTIYGGATTLGVMLPYSREHEYEADHIGMILMSKAGYNPRYALSFWEKFSQASQSSGIGEYFSTHPMGEKRIEHMLGLLPEMLDHYDKAKTHHDVGVVYKK